jgi:apolipoprotein N-acyltransferase
MTADLFKNSPFKLAFLGAALLWASFPPVDFWPLAWIAPVPWVLLIRREKLGGRRPYLVLWLAGFTFWMAVLHWLRLPYWAVGFGWAAMSAYFAFYLPVFICLSRIAVHQLRLPVILAAPIVWTGLELARAHLLTGMTMASLAHTQYRWVELIQISDLAGAYGVSFVVMFIAACLAQISGTVSISASGTVPISASGTVPISASGTVPISASGTVPISAPAKMGLSPSAPPPRRKGLWRAFWPLLPALAVLAAVLWYGNARMVFFKAPPDAKIALIQGSIDSTFGGDENLRETMYLQYFELSRQAVDKYGHVDLIVWPEIFFLYPLIIYDADAGTKDPELRARNISIEDYRKWLQSCAEAWRKACVDTAGVLHCPLLMGLDARHITADGERIYNSAAYVSASGELLGRYDKMHLVMFGEYIPLAGYFTWLYKLTPLSMPTMPGTTPVAFRVPATSAAGSSGSAAGRGVLISPNICYESVLPHIIRRQINTLKAEGKEPDVLVNLTNDGWFRGASELDLHLACGVFRAVECRKPFLIAANTGFSAWIDANGRILAKGPRRDTAVLLAEVRADRRKSRYLYYGDWPAGICLAACCIFAAFGFWKRFRPG